MNRLRDTWAAWSAQCLPADAGDDLKLWARRAFYAGAVEISLSMAEASAEGISDEEADARLDALLAELSAFTDDIAAGRG